MTHNQEVGLAGEMAAIKFVAGKGYKVLEHHWHNMQWGELDLVTVKDNILVFIEVKSRLSNQFGNPEEAVTPHKISSLKRSAQYYSTQHPELPKALRIDVVSVILEPETLKPLSFELFEDAQQRNYF